MKASLTHIITYGLIKSAETLESIIMLCKEGFKNPFKNSNIIKNKSQRLKLLVNGPSLKNFINSINGKERDCDYLVVNDFSTYEIYSKVKPLHYVLSDQMFFMATLLEDRAREILLAIEKDTDWSMNLFIPQKYKNSSFLNGIKKNGNIHIIPFHGVRFRGFKKIRFYLYRKGLGSAFFGTVATPAIYISIMLEYSNVFLYGMDHTFFDGLYVNEENQLFYAQKHVHNDELKLRPMMCHYDGNTRPYNMSFFLEEKTSIFKGHKLLNEFSKEQNVKLINCTANSLIDSYPRK